MELDWWMQNLDLNNGRCILSTAPQMVIQSDASKSGWGVVCQGQSAGGPWSQEERREHINLLELKAVHMAVLIFADRLKPESIHLQMDNQAALAYIRKMGGGGAGKGGGGTLNQKMNQVCKELWELVIGNGITITVECLLGKLSTLADEVSRKKDSSERKLNPRIFQKLCYVRGRPEIDLFATRVTTQLQAYFSWRTDHLSQRTDAFQQSWKNLKTYAFPPFSLVGRVLKKNPERACKPSFFLH